jgi:leucine efflux protein
MLGVTDLRTYLIGTIAIVLLPGPNSMYVLSTAATYGVRRGYRAATGVFLGDAVLMVASAAAPPRPTGRSGAPSRSVC